MRSKVKSLKSSTRSRGSLVSPKREAKTLGTRAGILRDWRGASGRSAKVSGSRRETLRDGR